MLICRNEAKLSENKHQKNKCKKWCKNKYETFIIGKFLLIDLIKQTFFVWLKFKDYAREKLMFIFPVYIALAVRLIEWSALSLSIPVNHVRVNFLPAKGYTT